MAIHVKQREIVVPGQVLVEGMDFVPASGTYRDGALIYASQVGLVDIKGRVVKVIPLAGVYIPNKEDVVIGVIMDISYAGWQVDIRSPYSANLPLGEAVSEYVDLLKVDLSKYFDIGDVIVTKIINVTRSKIVQLTIKGPGLRKLSGGRIVEITPSKVPRLIGRKGSMINMIKSLTECEIIVGQNGRVWVKGKAKQEMLAVRAIFKVEQESHLSGLTNRIKAMLEEKR
jgi:exosome complex component RRP4